MKRRPYLVIVVLLSLAWLLSAAVACIPEEPPQTGAFPDPRLAAAIRNAIDKLQGELVPEDCRSLTTLDARGFRRHIRSIAGLENCVDLVYLDLGENKISDLSPLTSLTRLTELWLDINDIQDVTPLSHLNSLTKLYLGYNHIEDVTPLSPLFNLTKLHLQSNDIRDIAPLSPLVNLSTLQLGSNELSDLSPLSTLVNLTDLYLDYNHIVDVTPLSSLVNLNILTLSGNGIRDIGPLVLNAGLGQGDKIWLDRNKLKMWPGLTFWPWSKAKRDIVALKARGVWVFD